MIRLFLIIYTLASTAAAGIAIIAVLTMNMFDAKSIIVAAILGAVAALPVAWIVAKNLSDAA